MSTDTEEERREAYKSQKKYYLSWKEAHARVEEVCGPVSIGHLKNIANRRDTFTAGKRADAPLVKLFPVDRASFERWLYGKKKK